MFFRLGAFFRFFARKLFMAHNNKRKTACGFHSIVADPTPKRRKIGDQSMDDMIISDDVLHNILSRLSAKPLMRFRCASKHWNSLITDPYFINSRSSRMILISPRFINLPPHCFYALDDKHPNIVKHTYPFEGRINESDVVGTFNGIVIWVLQKLTFDGPRIFILYNPLTRAIKTLPDFPSNSCCESSMVSPAYGFGHGKIIFKGGSCTCHSYDKYCNVFSLKKGSWTLARTTFRTNNYIGKVGMHLNGFLHWIDLLTTGINIVALDINEMVDTRIEEPRFSRDDYDRKSSVLGTLHGCLCLISKWHNGFDVWMLMNKEQSEWSKQYSFALPFYRCDYKVENLLDVCILEDGRIVVGDDVSKQVIICHLSERYYDIFKATSRLPCLIDFTCFKNVFEYVESLVSPSDICNV